MGTLNSISLFSTADSLFNGVREGNDTNSPKLPWTFDDQNQCQESHVTIEMTLTRPYCNAIWDTILCWPPVPAGTVSSQRCPPYKGVDPTKLAYKKCSVDGHWEGKYAGDYSRPQGWTNYTSCFTPEIKYLLDRLHVRADEAPIKIQLAQGIRIMELVGLSVSLLSLILSLIIFSNFRGLRNKTTRIHCHLFVAMTIQVIIRLILYTDQAIVRNDSTGLNTGRILHYTPGIDNTPILCELFYILLEYARTAMFMWMFVEGMYLHNLVAIAFFSRSHIYSIYCLVGWGSPLIFTGLWATFTAMSYRSTQCWWGYSLSQYFWILEGPRMLFISVNFLFLCNIIRILRTKLRTTNSSEAQQLRKSVKAAVILLPLLGITNIMNIIPPPLERSALEFGFWSYSTHFLMSFQGFFISLIHCFLNKDVKSVLLKRWEVFSDRRDIAYHLKKSRKSDQHSISISGEIIPMEMNGTQFARHPAIHETKL